MRARKVLAAISIALAAFSCRTSPQDSALAEVPALSPAGANPDHVLMLVGGEVPVDHPYAVTALETLRHSGYQVTTAPLAEPALAQGVTYSALLISDAGAYTHLETALKDSIDSFCQMHQIGIVFLYAGQGAALESGSLLTGESSILSAFQLAPGANVLSILRADNGATAESLPGYGRAFSWSAGAPYQAVASIGSGEARHPVAVTTTAPDAIRKIWLGMDLYHHWLTDLLILDATIWAAGAGASYDLNRWVGIDIDDVFQPNWHDDGAQRTVKIQASDVTELLAAQDRLSQIFIEPFHFNLGFNCSWYEKAFAPPPFDDVGGDRELVAHAGDFRWFDHLPGHEVATDLTLGQLTTLMQTSKSWADEHHVLPYIGRWVIAPAHLGEIPAYEPLFTSWKTVWNAAYTASPDASSPQTFFGITVVPRRGCDIVCSSDTYSMDQTSPEAISDVVHTQLLPTLTQDRLSLWISHQSGYARDRLALHAFEQALTSIKTWTNFKLHTGADEDLAGLWGPASVAN